MVAHDQNIGRQLRANEKHEAQKKNLIERWQTRMIAFQEFLPDAKKLWQETKLDPRVVWLVLGLYEQEQRDVMRGRTASCKSIWFDNIAPRADGKLSIYGLSGFTARMAKKNPLLIKIAGNGYVWPTELGYALAQYLHLTYTELNSSSGENRHSQDIILGDWGQIPAPLWRRWKCE